VQLERIITQKWIAMFPEGQEAWTEFGRTGYPKLFTVVNNCSNGTIDTQIRIRRLTYPSSGLAFAGPFFLRNFCPLCDLPFIIVLPPWF
jgi:hypothetical protein